MATYMDDEKLVSSAQPFLLLRRRPLLVELDDEETEMAVPPFATDRMRPAVSGALTGFAGGILALAVVHALVPNLLGPAIAHVAVARAVAPAAAVGIAYVTAAASGAIVGAGFAVVTRYLRKIGPLLVWALVFFLSLGLLLLAIAGAHGARENPALAKAIVAASATFAIIVSISLPIRRRR
jgi:hypothetical protein